jgi:hypothetical protein
LALETISPPSFPHSGCPWSLHKQLRSHGAPVFGVPGVRCWVLARARAGCVQTLWWGTAQAAQVPGSSPIASL